MPLLLNESTKNHRFLLWEIDREHDFLHFKDYLQPLIDNNKFKHSDKRTFEKQLVLELVRIMSEGAELKYDLSGAPFLLKDGQRLEISLSHSKSLAGIYACPNNNEVGIDIEEISQKATRVKEKFVHEDDARLKGLSEDESNTLIWTIKEAVYKLKKTGDIEFKTDIRISGFDSDNKVRVELRNEKYNENIWLHYNRIKDNFVTYTINNF